jgi:hypothetical protein
MNTTTILAIDLGKYNSVSCHYEPETKSATFRTTCKWMDSAIPLRNSPVRQSARLSQNINLGSRPCRHR